MAGPIAPLPARTPGSPTAPGDVLDWVLLLGVAVLLAWAAFDGLTFLPVAGFVQNGPHLAVFEKATLLIGIGALVRFLIGGRALPGVALLMLAAITGFCLLSLATTTDPYATREGIFFLISVIVLALVLLVSLNDADKVRWFVGALVLTSTVEAVVGLAQFAAREPTPTYWLSRAFAAVIRTRIYGTLGNPNVLADFLLIGIAGAVLLALDLPGRWRYLPIAALGVQVPALLFTYSRGGYIGFAVFLLAAAALLWPIRRQAWPVLLLVALLAGTVAAKTPAIGLRAGSITLNREDTATSRVFIWRTALNMWRAHWGWGTGLGAFNAAYPAYRPPGIFATYAIITIPGSAHNDYLQILAEAGLGGAILLAVPALWGLTRAGHRYVRGADAERAWLGTWGAAVAGIGAASLVHENLSVIPNVMMLVGFTAAIVAREALFSPRLPPLKRLAMLPLLAVLVCVPSLLPPLWQAPALHDVATRQVKEGDYARAVTTFRAALAVDPMNPVVPAYFGDLLADLYLRRIDTTMGPWRTLRRRAVDLYLRAEQLSRWDAYPRAALGRLRRYEGHYREARASLVRAIALDPYSARYRLWLGEVLVLSRDHAGAAEQLHEAVRLYRLELLMAAHHERHDIRFVLAVSGLTEAKHLLAGIERDAP